MPVSTIAQFKKSVRGSWAYLLVSKMSTTENLPTVRPAGWRSAIQRTESVPASTFSAFAAQIDGLADERARQPRIGNGLSDLVGFAAGKSGDAERVGQIQIPDRSQD